MFTLTQKSRRTEPQELFTAGSMGTDLWSYSAFTRQVTAALDGQHLRYSKRLRLLKQAENLGIRRFDANLIIALVQHRVETEPSIKIKEKSPKKSPFLSVAYFAIIQSIIILIAWIIIS